ncbi:MAG: hypothetical protein M3R35_04125 [Candidatus Eremiobacteraeota bacterium]|nr:hypothetical protein [Candidatus Eremiobacteraeota bacterium]
MRNYRFVLPAAALALALAVPQLASAASTFYGITTHVSTTNIKVRDPKTHRVLSFVLLPKFDQVFSDDGKTTYQMKKVHAGQYVGIIYDQKALGIRHADKIYLLNNRNQKIGKQ